MSTYTTCETCGGTFTWEELAESTQERLCEFCASGHGPADEEYDHEFYDVGYD